VLLNVDDMGKVKGSCDVQATQFMSGRTIERIVCIFTDMCKDHDLKDLIGTVSIWFSSPMSATLMIRPSRFGFEVATPAAAVIVSDRSRRR
jgi:hypothetical protein